MFVDLRNLTQLHGEDVIINILKENKPNNYGVQNNFSKKKIKTKCIFNEKTNNLLDTTSGSYLTKVQFEVYIPCEIAYSNKLKGAKITRDNGQILIIVDQPIKRNYATSSMFIATERKVYND